MAKKRKRRKRGKYARKRRREPLWRRLAREIPQYVLGRRFRWIATGVIGLVALAVLLTFAVQGDTYSIYALLLLAVPPLILLWTLPDVKLGLTASFLYVQPLLIYLPNTEYGYTKAIFSLGAISLLGLLWVGEMAFRRRADLQLTSLFWPILAVLGASLLSLINSEAFLADFQYVVLLLYFAFLYLFVANNVTHEGQIRVLLGTLLGSAVLASLYGLFQYYGVLQGAPDAGSGSGAMISTFGNPNYLAGFVSYLVAPGLLMLFYAKTRWSRYSSLFALAMITVTLTAIDSDSAWLASILSILVLVSGLVATGRRDILRDHRRWSAALLGLSLLFVVALYIAGGLWIPGRALTFPRSPWEIASIPAWAGLGALALLVASSWFKGFAQSLGRRRRWTGIAIALLVVIGVAVTPAGRSAITGMGETFVDRAGVRIVDWDIGMHMFRSHPMIGIGIGDYKREFLPYKARFFSDVGHIQRGAQAHNEYVQILAELGILGFLSTVGLIGMLLWGTFRRLKEAASPEIRFAILALFGGCGAFISDSAFSFPLHLSGNALAFVLIVGLLHSRALGEPRVALKLGAHPTQIAAGAMLIVALAVSVFAYRDWRADIDLDGAEHLVQSAQDRQRAQELLRRSVRWDFAPAEAYYWLGFTYVSDAQEAMSRGNGEQARQRFRQAEELLAKALPRFNTENTYYYLALSAQRLGKLKVAGEYIEQLLAIDPSPSLRSDVVQLRALVLYGQGEVQEAIKLLQDMIEEHPRTPELIFTLGQIHLDQGQREKAIEQFTRADALIDRELAELDRKLSPERSITVPRRTYSEWRSRKESLEQVKGTITRILERLGE